MQKLIKLLTIILPVIIIINLITGCTQVKSKNLTKPENAATYFHKGVYKSYSPDEKNYYFYVFYDENSGYTADNEQGIGLPFSCIQTQNSVKFKFGGSEEPEEIFKIQSTKNETVTGAFEDGKLLIFNYVLNANPDNFDAVEYLKTQN